MTKEAEDYIRYIQAKLPFATEKESEIISAIARGLGIAGFSHFEYQRDI